MSDIRLEKITKHFGATVALDDISLQIKDREFFVLLGPTGAGKTTTLRVIAGLEKQNAGDVYFDGENINELMPADRDTAFVFQQYSLYPNMSVFDNLAFPLRSPLRKTPEDEIRRRVLEAAEKLRITHLIERKTAKLSGGEMQRVSIGRAIVRSPRIFLMDEPLSNLDAKLRESLRVELKHLQKTQGSTTLFVTHDQIEALTMADRIAVLDAGKILQVGTPHDIYDRPATTFVAQLVGTPRINLAARAARQRRAQYRAEYPVGGDADGLHARRSAGRHSTGRRETGQRRLSRQARADRTARRGDDFAHPVRRAAAHERCPRHGDLSHWRRTAVHAGARTPALLRCSRLVRDASMQL